VRSNTLVITQSVNIFERLGEGERCQVRAKSGGAVLDTVRDDRNSPEPSVRLVGSASNNAEESVLPPIGPPGVASDPIVHTVLGRGGR
jgi:hypothetical protein